MSLTARPTPAGRMGRADKGISAPFGYSPQYSGGRVFHHGQDYYWLNADPAGSRKVYPAGPGTVSEVFWTDTMGGIITINHGSFLTRYNHMPKNSSKVKVGQKVTVNTFLGPMGNSGTAANGQYHLHFEVWKNGTRVDPEPYFSAPVPARPKDEVKRVAKYLNARKLVWKGKTLSSSADKDGVPGSNLYLMIQVAGTVDKIYNGEIDGITGPKTERAFDHYVTLTKPKPAPEPEPEPEEPEEPPVVVVPEEPEPEQPDDEDEEEPSKDEEPPPVKKGTVWSLVIGAVVVIGALVASVLAGVFGS